ncbi:MAG: LysM peptidoglycan-binding domain-containing protein [Sphingomonadales bacterium]|nr:MAG: LysM peptidoglycan-binding domain-containing protein [Sphingomonadales bacterium]TNF03994.1 MAG: LysM peptidoglycan-binding domain-containing protein [Sphingomonadales bacterium]
MKPAKIGSGHYCSAAALAIFLIASPFAMRTTQARETTASPIRNEQGKDNIRYVVRKGDTLYQLAADYMVERDEWRTVGRINRIANPRAIPVGTSLTIPVGLLKSEPLSAHIIGFKGDVRIEQGSRTTAMAAGQAVQTGMVIETGTNGFATLELSNGSRLAFPSRTRLRVTAMRRFLLTDSVDFDFLLEKGRLETSATPLGNKGGRYRIRTPIAVSAVRGTTFRVSYEDGAHPSLTEVVEGHVAVFPSGVGTEEMVSAGFGVSVTAAGAMAREALLPAPELQRPGRVQVDPQVTLSLAPISGAQRYHAQIARDAGFVELEQESYSNSPDIRFANIGDGQWFVRLTGIATSGLEGLPRTYAMRRVLTGINASAEHQTDGGYLFRWVDEGQGQRIYHFRLRADRPDSVPMIDEPGLTGHSLTLSDLPPGTYRWHVGVRQYRDGEDSINWSPEQELIVAAEESIRAPAPTGGASRKPD